MEEEPDSYNFDTKRIIDLTRNLHVSLKLVDDNSDFDIMLNSYKRAIKNYYVATIQKSQTMQNLGLFYIKVGFHEYSIDNKVSGSVTIRMDSNVDAFTDFLNKNDIDFMPSNLSKPEFVIFFDDYYEFEEIVDGILRHLA